MMKNESERGRGRGREVAADGLTNQTQAKAGPGAGIGIDHGRGQVRQHGRRARPLTSAEKACLDTGKEHRVLEDGGVHSPSLMPRISIGKLWHFKRQVYSQRLNIIIFHKLILFPLMGLLAWDFLTLWWINFVFMFINALFTFPRVKLWLVLRFSACAIVNHA